MHLANFNIKSKGKDIDELKQEVYNDPMVNQFLKENKITENIAELYFSKLYEFYNNKDGDGATRPKLVFGGGYISVVYKYQDNDEARRLKDGINTTRTYDSDFERLKSIKFEDLTKDKHNSKIIMAFQRLVDNYSYPNQVAGVWLHGHFGVGKTYMLAAVANELYEKGAGVTFRNLSNIMDSIYKSFDFKDGSTQRIEEQLKRAEVLFIDDIGAENVTNYSVSFLLPILQHRFENNLLTFFSSNLTQLEYLKMLETSIDRKLDAGRLLERIRGISKEIKLDGTNKRYRA